MIGTTVSIWYRADRDPFVDQAADNNPAVHPTSTTSPPASGWAAAQPRPACWGYYGPSASAADRHLLADRDRRHHHRRCRAVAIKPVSGPLAQASPRRWWTSTGRPKVPWGRIWQLASHAVAVESCNVWGDTTAEDLRGLRASAVPAGDGAISGAETGYFLSPVVSTTCQTSPACRMGTMEIGRPWSRRRWPRAAAGRPPDDLTGRRSLRLRGAGGARPTARDAAKVVKELQNWDRPARSGRSPKPRTSASARTARPAPADHAPPAAPARRARMSPGPSTLENPHPRAAQGLMQVQAGRPANRS